MRNSAGLGLMGIELRSLDTPDDPILITTAVLNQSVLVGPVDKHRREDLELWSALHALAYHGAGRHPLGVLTGDKPDRKLISGTRTWGTELTQLTVSELGSSAHPTPREQMAQAHSLRERLQQRMESDPASYSHLVGRAVTIQKHSVGVLPRRDGLLLDQIAEALKQDKGVLFTGPTMSPGGQGDYGHFGPLAVMVQAVPGISGFGIYMSYDFQVRRSEALAAFADRVAKKDEPGNDVVLITCGVPDERGWVSASDHSLFGHLWTAHGAGLDLLPKKPVHIRGIMIHASIDAPGLILLNDTEDVPWHAAAGSTALTGPPPGPLFQRLAMANPGYGRTPAPQAADPTPQTS